MMQVSAFDFDDYINTNPYPDFMDANQGPVDESQIDVWKLLADEVKSDDGLLKKIMEALWFDVTGTDFGAFSYISSLINYALMVVGLVAMAVFIFGFYKIFVSDGEEGIQDAKKIVIGATIALAIIGLARFITRFAFSIFETSAEWL